MAALMSMFSAFKVHNPSKTILNAFIQQRNYAKRRGVVAMKTAKLAKAGKLSAESTSKKGLIVKSGKVKVQEVLSKMDKNIRMDEPIDNVYCFHNYKFQTYSLAEAMEMHRESHHPTIYNDPNAIVNAFLELDMSLHKSKTKYLDKFSSRVSYPHELNVNEPYKVLVICKRPEEEAAARAAGAYLVATTDYIKLIKKGEVPHDDFDFCVTTPDLLPELVSIRGILNKRFPNTRSGTVGFDVGSIVKKLSTCIEYRVVPNPPEPQYAWITTPIARLQMSLPEIEANLSSLVTNICLEKSSKLGPPIIRLLFLTCPPTNEKFLISHDKFVPVVDESSDDEGEAAAAKTQI